MEFRLIIYKLVCDSCKPCNFRRDKLAWIYKTLILADDFTIMYFNQRGFSYPVIRSIHAGRFYISYNKGCIADWYRVKFFPGFGFMSRWQFILKFLQININLY